MELCLPRVGHRLVVGETIVCRGFDLSATGSQNTCPPESLSTAFAKVLRRERLAKGLSQEALAHQAGLHRTYVGLIERGLRNPTIDVGNKLARALRTTLSEMIRESERRL